MAALTAHDGIPHGMLARWCGAVHAVRRGHLSLRRCLTGLTMIPVLVLVLVLLGCGTPSVLTDPRTERVRIGPDLFHVLVDGDAATVANFSTGTNLMLRVEEGARQAAEQVSGCRVTTMVKAEAINRWQMRLRCP